MSLGPARALSIPDDGSDRACEGLASELMYKIKAMSAHAAYEAGSVKSKSVLSALQAIVYSWAN